MEASKVPVCVITAAARPTDVRLGVWRPVAGGSADELLARPLGAIQLVCDVLYLYIYIYILMYIFYIPNSQFM